MKSVVLDNSAYNHIVEEGKESIVNESIEKGIIKILKSHIEEDQIEETENKEKRKKMQSIKSESVPTETTVYDISRFGGAKLGNGKKMGVIKGKSQKFGTIKDGLIAEVATNADIFVSDDKIHIKRFLKISTKTSLLPTKDFIQWLEKELNS